MNGLCLGGAPGLPTRSRALQKIPTKTSVLTALLWVLLGSPQTSGPVAAATEPLDRDGLLLVYLRPPQPEASQIEFRLGRATAVAGDGSHLGLPIIQREISGIDQGRQTLLLEGTLPSGLYSGLSLEIVGATVATKDGPVKMATGSGPFEIDSSFRIERRQAQVLEIDFRASFSDTYRFQPVFHAHRPPRPADGLLALVSDQQRHAVLLLDKGTGEVVGAVPTGRDPSGIALDPRRPRAYVAVTGDDLIVALGLLEFRILATLGLRTGDEPLELAITPDGDTLLAVDRGSRTLSVIDPFSMVELDRITVGDLPTSVVIDAEGRRAFVLNRNSASVTVIDIATRTLVGTVATDPSPFRGQLTEAGESLLLIHAASPYLSFVDTEDLVVSDRLYVGPGASALKLNPQTDLIYLGRNGLDVVEIFDPISLLPIDSVPVNGNVSFMNFDGENNRLYLLLPELQELRALAVVGKQRQTSTRVGASPYWVSISGEQ